MFTRRWPKNSQLCTSLVSFECKSVANPSATIDGRKKERAAICQGAIRHSLSHESRQSTCQPVSSLSQTEPVRSVVNIFNIFDVCNSTFGPSVHHTCVTCVTQPRAPCRFLKVGCGFNHVWFAHKWLNGSVVVTQRIQRNPTKT